MRDALQWTISNTLADITSLIERVHDRLTALQIPPDTCYSIELAMEEMLTNTVKFSFDDTNPHGITVTLSPAADAISLQFVDDGHEFNPLAAAEPDTALPLEDRPIGGLGIMLVRRMAGRTDYRREGGKNILTLTYPQTPQQGKVQ